MKAWQVFLFMYILQALVISFLPFFDIGFGGSAVIYSDSDVDDDVDAISESNQYLQQTLYQEKRFKNGIWDVLIGGIMPTGYYFDQFFDVPSLFMALLNSLWFIITTLAVLEFLRGFSVTG
jgi:hypothetical protein